MVGDIEIEIYGGGHRNRNIWKRAWQQKYMEGGMATEIYGGGHGNRNIWRGTKETIKSTEYKYEQKCVGAFGAHFHEHLDASTPVNISLKSWTHA